MTEKEHKKLHEKLDTLTRIVIVVYKKLENLEEQVKQLEGEINNGKE